MPMDSQELTEALAAADRQILLLRQATGELAAAGRQILEQREARESDDVEIVANDIDDRRKRVRQIS